MMLRVWVSGVGRLVCASLLLCFGLVMAGCRSAPVEEAQAQASLVQKDWSAMAVRSHEVYAGRAVIQVPDGVKILIRDTRVNGVQLKRLDMPVASFAKAWDKQVAEIGSGRAEIDGQSVQTVLKRTFPAEQTMLYGEAGSMSTEFTLEHWQRFGETVIRGRIVIVPADLEKAQKAIRDVFATVAVDRAPGKGDFVFDGGVAHTMISGYEMMRAEWVEPVPATDAGTSVPLTFQVETEVVNNPGHLDLLQRHHADAGLADGLKVRAEALQQGPRKVATLSGEEYVEVLTAGSSPLKSSFGAWYQGLGRSFDPLAPSLDLDAQTDSYAKLDHGKVLAYWNATLRGFSFR